MPRGGLFGKNRYSAPASDSFDIELDTGANIKSASEAVFTYQIALIKDRDNSNNNQFIDSVRGTSNVLVPNSTAAETTYSTPSGSSAAWVWDVGSSGSSNTDGTITTTAASTGGNSAFLYQGNGSGGSTIGHGLPSTPEFFIVKDRDASSDWFVYHASLGATKFLELEGTNAAATSTFPWNDTAPTSSVITLGSGSGVNTSGNDYVCFAWASSSGVSKFGTYTGNTTTEPSITGLGSTGRFVIIKRTDSTGNWVMIDSERGVGNYLYANSSASEGSASYITFTSDGFDIDSGVTASDINANGGTYIYALWA